MVNFHRAGDIKSASLHILFLLYGDPGVGKTHAVSLSPRPFVLLTEKNGMTTVIRANPDAIVCLVTNVDELREVIRMAVKGELPEDRRTFVVDGLTEVQRLFYDEIMSKKKPGDIFMLQDWGTLAEKMRRFMRTLRDLPYHVAATALSETREADDGVRYTRPQFDGKKTGSEVAQYFNGVAYMFKRVTTDADGNRKVIHQAMFDGPSKYIVKPCHPVAGIMDTNVGEWFEALRGSDEDNNAEQAGGS